MLLLVLKINLKLIDTSQSKKGNKYLKIIPVLIENEYNSGDISFNVLVSFIL